MMCVCVYACKYTSCTCVHTLTHARARTHTKKTDGAAVYTAAKGSVTKLPCSPRCSLLGKIKKQIKKTIIQRPVTPYNVCVRVSSYAYTCTVFFFLPVTPYNVCVRVSSYAYAYTCTVSSVIHIHGMSYNTHTRYVYIIHTQ